MPADARSAHDAIAAAELFRGLSSLEHDAVAALAKPVQVRAGTRIFNLGEEATSLFLVASGTVSLMLPLVVGGSAKEVTVDEKSSGSVIAWSALVPPHKLAFGGVAKTDALLVGLGRSGLEALFAAQPRLHLVTLGNLNRVIASRVALLEALLIRDLQRQVAEQYA